LAILVANYSFSQTTGRKLYPGMTKTRGTSTVPISRQVAYKWTWNIGIGRASYLGTLCQTGDCLFKFTDLNFQINAGLKYRLDNQWTIGVSLRYFNVASSDNQYGTDESGRKQRNLSFSTQGYEFMVFGSYDIIPLITKFIGEKADQYNRRNFCTPYLTGGVGLLYFNPQTEYNGKMVNLHDVITDDYKEQGHFYSQFTPVVSLGAGVRLKVSEFFDIGADVSMNRPFTQSLDDISSSAKYPSWNTDRSKAPDQTSWDLADRHPVGQRVDPEVSANPYRGYAPGKHAASADYYFIFNIRLDYTLSHLFKFDNPRHMHFQGGKGSKHHHFNSR
jgi:hypothetical protein